MTYRRAPGGLHDAWSRVAERIGPGRLAAALGVSTSRVEQLRNPMRRDLAPVELSIRADVEAARKGHGCPIYEAYGRALAEAGVASPSAARARALERAAQACVRRLRQAAAGLEDALGPAAAGEAA